MIFSFRAPDPAATGTGSEPIILNPTMVWVFSMPLMGVETERSAIDPGFAAVDLLEDLQVHGVWNAHGIGTAGVLADDSSSVGHSIGFVRGCRREHNAP